MRTLLTALTDPDYRVCGMRVFNTQFLLLIITCAGIVFDGNANAEIVGIARVIDADTIEVSGQCIRLHGIDTPEAKQTCKSDDVEWRWGRDATRALHDKFDKKPIRSKGQDKDRYGPVIGKCVFADTDINEWLVLQGWAVAYARYSRDYAKVGASAQSERQASASMFFGRSTPARLGPNVTRHWCSSPLRSMRVARLP